MNQKEQSIIFWNHFFEEREPISIKKRDLERDSILNRYLKIVGDTCENVLDIGCGTGICLMLSSILGSRMETGIGFDTSTNAIQIANQTKRLSKIKDLSFIVNDESFLSTLKDESFDGIICSNVIDVLPPMISNDILLHVKRILKPGGIFLLKLNFFLDQTLIEKYKMIEVEENLYEMNGVIRSYNLSTEAWIQKMQGFEVLKVDGYQRAEGLPLDRIILFSKRKCL